MYIIVIRLGLILQYEIYYDIVTIVVQCCIVDYLLFTR